MSYLRGLTTIAVAAFFTLSFAASQAWVESVPNNEEANFYDIQKTFNEYWSDKEPGRGTGWKQFKRAEYFWEPRVFPTGELPDGAEIIKSVYRVREKNRKNDDPYAGETWEALGPYVKPEQKPYTPPNDYTPPTGVGRVNCLAFHPTNINVMYAGASFGGIWKTEDGGNNWRTFPFTEHLSIGISDIAVSPTDPDFVYAATGDSEASGVLGMYFNFSIGILMTSDGGDSWHKTAFEAEPNSKLLINRLLVHPQNPRVVYAAANNGVYKTDDAGENWNRISFNYCKDLEFKPGNPSVMIGAFLVGQNQYVIRKYSESQNSWSDAQTFTNVTRVALVYSDKEPNRAYALCAAPDGGFHSFWKSDNAGATWSIMSSINSSPNYLSFLTDGSQGGGQGLYDLCLAVSPNDEDQVYLGAINVWKSIDAGATFQINTDWLDLAKPWVHADHHWLGYSPNKILFSGHDGGISKTSNGGAQWIDITDNLDVAQIYKVSSYEGSEDLIAIGTQDCGTHLYSDGEWSNIMGGDGMDCLVDYSNSNYMYASVYYGGFRKSSDGGKSFNRMIDSYITQEQGAWVTPIEIHPTNPATLFVGYRNLWRSDNRGSNWSKISNISGGTIRAIAVSESNPNYIYVASLSGDNAAIFGTANGGAAWTTVARPNNAVTSIAIDPENPQRIWYSMSGYAQTNKVVFMDLQSGETENLFEGFPNVPVNTLVYQKNSPDRLYAGTDSGVFYRDAGMNEWRLYGDGLPNVVVADLEIHSSSGYLRAGTYGRGLWQIKVNDCDLEAPEIDLSSDPDLCEGEELTITVVGDYDKVTWSDGSNGKSITVSEPGNYSATIQDDKGCTATSDIVTVQVFEIPEVEIENDDTNPICEGETATLEPSKGFLWQGFEWSTGETTRRIEVSEPGEYYCTITTRDGCESTTEPYVLEVNPSPEKPTITRDGDVLTASEIPNVSYQWIRDGLKIPGATDRTHTVRKSGEFSVEVENEYECSKISDPVNIDYQSVEELIERYSFSVGPNPAKAEIAISAKFKSAENITITLSDLTGSILYETNSLASGRFSETIDLSDLSAGAFILKVKTTNGVIARKIVKE